LTAADDGRYSAEVRIMESGEVRCKLVLPTSCQSEAEAMEHVSHRVAAWLADWTVRSESGFTPI
jgi:pyruvate/2-oxoglutarate/acetoin dehydrogenase E1 component